jgi:hypothetical protein
LALGLKAKAALGLFIGADTDVPECSSHWGFLLWWSGGYAGGRTLQAKSGREGPLASSRTGRVAPIARRADFRLIGLKGAELQEKGVYELILVTTAGHEVGGLGSRAEEVSPLPICGRNDVDISRRKTF